jgi:hypothetical protein
MVEEENRTTKVISIVIQTALYLGDFDLIVKQLTNLENFVFIIKSKTYTSESIKNYKVTIASSSDDLYSDMHNLKL